MVFVVRKGHIGSNFVLELFLPKQIKNKIKDTIINRFRIILDDHEEINEELANKILNTAKEKNADIITTEKDVVRLNHTKEGSYRKELSLKSNIAKLNIELDKNYLIGLIENGLNITH